jgi:hypothetical protein
VKHLGHRAAAAILSAAALVLAGLGAPAASAAAKYPGVEHGKGFIVVDPNAPDVVHKGNATFIPTGPVDANTVIVVRGDDGSLPGGMTLDQVAAKVSSGAGVQPMTFCDGLTVWGAKIRSYSNISSAQCSMAGNPDAHVSYLFWVTPGTEQWALGYGLGNYLGYNGSDFGLWSQYYSLGQASSDSPGGNTVPWGNVWGYPKFYAFDLSYTFFAAGVWTY